MLDNGKCRCSRHVIPVSSCLLYFMYLPNHSSASENSVQWQSVHFAPELSVLSLVQLRGALPIKDLQKKPKWHLALTAGCKSSLSVLTTWLCLFSSTSKLQPGQLVMLAKTGAKANDNEDSVYSSCSLAVCGGVDSRMALVCSNLSVEISSIFLCWRCCCIESSPCMWWKIKSVSCWQLQIKSNWTYLYEHKK